MFHQHLWLAETKNKGQTLANCITLEVGIVFLSLICRIMLTFLLSFCTLEFSLLKFRGPSWIILRADTVCVFNLGMLQKYSIQKEKIPVLPFVVHCCCVL